MEPVDPTPPESPASPSATTRFYILDLVRLVAILVMIVGHSLDALVTPEELDIRVYPWNVWNFGRGLTAPLFLIVSGAVQIFANERGASGRLLKVVIGRRVRWFLLLVAVGYAMSFPVELLYRPDIVTGQQWDNFARVHILQLIGVTGLGYLFIMALTRSNGVFALWALGVGIAVSAVTPLVFALDAYQVLPSWAANYLGAPAHLGKGALFPVFPYSAYMFLGAGLGWFLKRTAPEKRGVAFCAVTLFAGLVLAGAGRLGWVLFDSETFWQSHPCVIVLRTGLCLLIMTAVGIVYRVTRKIERLYAMVGKKALHIFVAHILILYGGPGFAGVAWRAPRALTLAQGLGVAFGLVAICLAGALAAASLEARRKKKTRSDR